MRILLCALLLPALATARAQMPRVKIGDVSINLPAPAGFLRFDGKSKTVDIQRGGLLAAGNRLLAAYATPEDLQEVLKDRAPPLARNFNAQTFQEAEDQDLRAAEMRDLKRQIVSDMAPPDILSPELKKAEDEGGRKLAALMKPGEKLLLGAFGESPESISFTLLLKPQPSASPHPSSEVKGAKATVRNKGSAREKSDSAQAPSRPAASPSSRISPPRGASLAATPAPRPRPVPGREPTPIPTPASLDGSPPAATPAPVTPRPKPKRTDPPSEAPRPKRSPVEDPAAAAVTASPKPKLRVTAEPAAAGVTPRPKKAEAEPAAATPRAKAESAIASPKPKAKPSPNASEETDAPKNKSKPAPDEGKPARSSGEELPAAVTPKPRPRNSESSSAATPKAKTKPSDDASVPSTPRLKPVSEGLPASPTPRPRKPNSEGAAASDSSPATSTATPRPKKKVACFLNSASV